MPDSRKHRGPGPQDAAWFGPEAWPALRSAVGDLSWLLTRGYAETSALKLVGDRWRLTERQRMGVRRSACSDPSLRNRRERSVPLASLADTPLWIDGFNLITTLESALGGGVLLRGRDGCVRDLAGVHGTYRRVEETRPALELLADRLAGWKVGPVTWYLDQPVSNSGRLRGILLGLAERHGLPWSVELVMNPDPILSSADEVVVTADSVILDHCRRWANLARAAIETSLPSAIVVDLEVE